MAIVVTCAACGKRLNIPEQLFNTKIRGRVVTIGCKGCAADIRVDGTDPSSYGTVDSVPPPAQPAPAAETSAPSPVASGKRPAPAALPAAATAPVAPEATPAPGVTREEPKPPAPPEPVATAKEHAAAVQAGSPPPTPGITPPGMVAVSDPGAELDALGSWSLPPPAIPPAQSPAKALLPAPPALAPVAGAPTPQPAPAIPPAESPAKAVLPAPPALAPAAASAPQPAPAPSASRPQPAPALIGTPGAGQPKATKSGPKFDKPSPFASRVAATPAPAPEPRSALRGDKTESSTTPKPPLGVAGLQPSAAKEPPTTAKEPSPPAPKEPSSVLRVDRPDAAVPAGMAAKQEQKPAARQERPVSLPLGLRSMVGKGAGGGVQTLPRETPRSAPLAPPVQTREPRPALGVEMRASSRAGAEPKEKPATFTSSAALPAPAPTPGIMDLVWAVSFSDDDDRELSFTEILKALRLAQISSDTIVWREGMAEWLPLGQVPEFEPYLDALADDAPTRIRRPEDVEALKREVAQALRAPSTASRTAQPPELPGSAAKGRIESLPPDFLRAASEPPRIVDADSPELIESLPPDVLSSLSEPPIVVDSLSPELMESIPPEPALPRFDGRPPPAVVQSAALAAATGAADRLKVNLPRSQPAFSLPPSLPPELKRRVPLWVWGVAVAVLLGGAVLALIVSLAQTPQEPDVVIPAGPLASTPVPTAVPSRTQSVPAQSEAAPSTPTASSYGDAQGMDLAAAIEKSLGKDTDKAGAPFNRKLAQALLTTAAARAAACRRQGDQKGPAEVDVTFESSGRVSRAQVKPPYADTGTARCITLTFEALKMRPFTGPNVVMTQRVMIR